MSLPEQRPGVISSLDDLPRVLEVVEQRSSSGIALLIVGLDPRLNGDNIRNPLIWTITERQDKPDTEKRAGDLSVPAETRKIGEDRLSNVLGALAEFCGDNDLPYVREHLFLLNGVFRERGINVRGIQVDMSVLVYNGLIDFQFNPLNSTEVAPNRWIHRDEIPGMGNVRSVLRQAIEIDRQEGLSSRVLDTYHEHPELLKPAFPVELRSMGDFYARREIIGDIPLATG